MSAPSERDCALKPQGGRYDGPELVRQYQGSSLVAANGILTFTPAPRVTTADWSARQRQWSAAIGMGPGQVARVTLLSGLLEMVRGSASVSVYAFTDSRGTVVGFVPTGWGLSDSSLPEHERGWYSPERVRTFASELGVTYTEAASYGADLSRLNRDFPGAVNHMRLITVLRWADVVTCLLGGIAFVVIPAASASDTHGVGGWIVGGLMFVFGVSMLWLGARNLPAIARRRAARQAARPSDAGDRHKQSY